MTAFYKYFLLRAQAQKAQVSFWSVFGVLLLLVAYLSSPQTFNNFCSYVIHYIFNVADKNFDKGKDK